MYHQLGAGIDSETKLTGAGIYCVLSIGARIYSVLSMGAGKDCVP